MNIQSKPRLQFIGLLCPLIVVAVGAFSGAHRLNKIFFLPESSTRTRTPVNKHHLSIIADDAMDAFSIFFFSRILGTQFSSQSFLYFVYPPQVF